MSFAPLRQTISRPSRYLFLSRHVPTPLGSIAPFFHCTYASDTNEPPLPPPGNQTSTHGNKPEKPATPTNNNDDQNNSGDAAAATEASPTPDPQEELKKQLAEKDKKLAELKDAYLRCIADQENIRERSRKELESAKDYAIQSFAKELLDTVDILNMALTSVPEEFHTKASAEAVAAGKDDIAVSMADQLSNLYTGVSMTQAELIKTLRRNGIEQHDPQGEVFDPKLHQALFQAPMPDKTPGTIFSVQKLGYTIKGRVLRPAQVGVVAESK
ncbi:unnamed protein product [Absidia cylindrospora]